MGEPTLLGPSGHAVRFDQSLPSKCTSSALSTLVAYTAPQGYLFRSQVSSKPPPVPARPRAPPNATQESRIKKRTRGGGRQPSLLPLQTQAGRVRLRPMSVPAHGASSRGAAEVCLL